MPQLDLFTLLFQFKSFFFFFCLLYFYFLFYLVPKLHLIIRLRRFQIRSFYFYYILLKSFNFLYFSKNINLIVYNLKFTNTLYLLFCKNLSNKFSIFNLLSYF